MKVEIVNTGNRTTQKLKLKVNSTVPDILHQCSKIAGTSEFDVMYGGKSLKRYGKSTLINEIIRPELETQKFYLSYPKEKPKKIPPVMELEESPPTTPQPRLNKKREFLRNPDTIVRVTQGRGIYKRGIYKGIILLGKNVNHETEFLEELIQQKQNIATLQSKISENNKDLSDMVLSAKKGNWDDTLSILERKPFLVNGIPQERAWSVLHQAAFQNHGSIIQTLLKNKNCDISIKAKRDWDNCGDPGDTPLEIAKRHNAEEAVEILKTVKVEVGKSSPPTFVAFDVSNQFIKEGIPYFLLAVAFMSEEKVDSLHLEDSFSFQELTKNIFDFLQNDWEYARTVTSECLYPFDQSLHQVCLSATDAGTFFGKLLWIYTTNAIYREVNAALRRSSEDIKPTADDLLLCLYSLYLQCIMLHWDELETYKGISYRGMVLQRDQVALYKEGVKFGWLSFGSNIKIREHAEGFSQSGHSDLVNTVFVIDNTIESKWSPRELKKFTVNIGTSGGEDDFGENELVYPAGAQFQVTSVARTRCYDGCCFCVEIELKLLSPPI